MAKATGLEAALAEQLANATLPGDDAEQLELNEIAQLPLLGSIKVDGREIRPGRPKGALNKSTKELANYVLSRHRHPILAAAEVADMPLQALALALSCEKLDAAKYQQQCREFVARYTLQAMPQSVQVDMGTVGMLYVINQAAPRPGEDQERSEFALDLTPVQNQEVSSDEDGKSHEEKSHGSE